MRLGLRSTRSFGISIVMWTLLAMTRRSVGQNDVQGDLLCLKRLTESFSPGSSLDFLVANWTGADFPCTGNSSFAGLICSNRQVREIKLTKMNLKGGIPSEIIQCIALSNLDLSDNELSGAIPPEVGQLVQLAVLNLSANSFTGEIPDFSKATYTNVIDLHDNHLSGSIPLSLGYLARLTTFDVSNNDLSGPIPTNLANTSTGAPRFNISCFEGNKGLYGYPIAPPTNHGLSVLAIVGIGLGSGMLSLVVSFTAVCIWLRVTEQRGAAEEGKISQLMPES